MNKSAVTIAVSLVVSSLPVSAVDGFLAKGRSLGYGGAGTTYAHWSEAANYNPALVGAAAGSDHDFFIVLKGAGRITDISENGDTPDVIEDFGDDVDRFDEFNNVDLLEGDKGELQRIIDDSNQLISSVATLNGVGARAEFGGNASFGLAFQKVAFSAHISSQFDIAGSAGVSDADLALLRRYTQLGQVLLDDVRPLFDEAAVLEQDLLQKEQALNELKNSGSATDEDIATATALVTEAESLFREADLLAEQVKNQQTTIENDFGDIFDQNTQTITFNEKDLESVARFAAIGWFEVGLTAGSKYRLKNGQSINYGATLKSVHLELFDYQVGAATFDEDDIDGDDVRNSTNFTTADLGVIWSLDPADKWRIGGTIKNIVGEEISSNPIRLAEGQQIMTYKVEPQVRLGASYNGGWFRLAADVDLTESNGPKLANGRQFFRGSQYANIGLVLNAWDFIELRGGYRHNFASSTVTTDTEKSEGAITFGAGLYLGSVQFDLSFQASPELDDVGGGIQTMITW